MFDFEPASKPADTLPMPDSRVTAEYNEPRILKGYSKGRKSNYLNGETVTKSE